MEIEKIDYLGWEDCYHISNGIVELVIPSSFGIRIMHFGFQDRHNELAVIPPDSQEKDVWHFYGGHRLWFAPENAETYTLDNDTVEFVSSQEHILVRQSKDAITGIQKEIELHLDENRAHAKIVHRLYNRGSSSSMLAPWALSVMAPGGRGIVPLPVHADRSIELQPLGNFSLWSYTDMADPRWQWMHKYLTLHQFTHLEAPQKIGVSCLDGWIGYINRGHLFIKTFTHDTSAHYPDGGCSAEIYTNHQFLEVETLGPLIELAPGEKVEHVEDWYLFEQEAEIQTEADVDQYILPMLQSIIE
jgi:hypothetical protein